MTSNDLSCRDFVEFVTDYHERALEPRELIRIEQHLVVCSACTRYEEQMRATIRIAGTLELDELGPETRRALTASLQAYLRERE